MTYLISPVHSLHKTNETKKFHQYHKAELPHLCFCTQHDQRSPLILRYKWHWQASYKNISPTHHKKTPFKYDKKLSCWKESLKQLLNNWQNDCAEVYYLFAENNTQQERSCTQLHVGKRNKSQFSHDVKAWSLCLLSSLLSLLLSGLYIYPLQSYNLYIP